MLRSQDIEAQIGRTVGGDFIKAVHTPTGISRVKGPPLPKSARAKQEMLDEIEFELIQKGLVQHILSDRSSK